MKVNRKLNVGEFFDSVDRKVCPICKKEFILISAIYRNGYFETHSIRDIGYCPDCSTFENEADSEYFDSLKVEKKA